MDTGNRWEGLRQLATCSRTCLIITCDAAWCAPCRPTWAPLRWLSLFGAL